MTARQTAGDDFVEWLIPMATAIELLGGETAVRETALTLLEIGD